MTGDLTLKPKRRKTPGPAPMPAPSKKTLINMAMDCPSAQSMADELGVSLNTLKGWLSQRGLPRTPNLIRQKMRKS